MRKPVIWGALMTLLITAGILWPILHHSPQNTVGVSSPHMPESMSRANASPSSAPQTKRDTHTAPTAVANTIPPTPNGAMTDELTLSYRSQAGYEKALANLERAGISILDHSPDLKSIRVRSRTNTERSILSGMAGTDAEVGYNFLIRVPPQPAPGTTGNGTKPFGPNAGQFIDAPRNQTLGRGVKVAVIDSGIQPHSALDNANISVLGQAGPHSELAHGTAVAAIIVGQDEQTPGIAQSAQILDIPVLDTEGKTDAFTLAQGIVDATNAGAQVINLSLGAQGDAAVLHEAVRYASNAGVVLIASAGNEGSGQVSYPAAYPEVVAVASLDAAAQPTPFSNFGQSVDIAAPGVGLRTAWADNALVEFSGTSASAPVVSGAVAALLSENPGMSGQQAVEVLLKTANDSGAPGKDPYLGAGSVNLGRMLQYDTPGVSDLAIADHYIVRDQSDLQAVSVWVTVQNRGTQWNDGGRLSIQYEGRSEHYQVKGLNPGESTFQEILLNPQGILTGPGTTISSQIESQTEDVFAENNKRVSTISAPGIE